MSDDPAAVSAGSHNPATIQSDIAAPDTWRGCTVITMRCILMVEHTIEWRRAMASVPTTDTDAGELTLADLDASVGTNPDRTGDFEAGRTHFHASSDDFLECLESQPFERDND